MEIRWLGQASFEIKTGTGTVICDPSGGQLPSGTSPDPNTVVTMSRKDGQAPGLPDTVTIFDRPGEYEVAGISIRGVATPGADRSGSRTVNTVFLIDAEGMTVCLLGLPANPPDAPALQMIGPVDVLLLRTDGQGLSMEQRAAAVRSIDPKVVIPTGFDAAAGSPGQALSRFLSQMGIKQTEAQPRLTVSRSSLPDQLRVVVLSARQ